MKIIHKSLIAFLLIFVFTACEDKIDELNVDPDTFPSANDAQILTSAQGFLSYVVDVDLNMGSFLWAQYYTWGIGVSIGNEERFVSEPSNYNGYWERAYSECLIDLKALTKSESPAYRGVGKALQAYIYQGLVDHFGDIPYSEAISGEIEAGGILTPAYDDAATIYGDLVTVLDDAIADLNLADDGDIGADDLVYGGDIDNWIRFAHSLKLRVLMRTSEVAPQEAAVEGLISSGIFIEDQDQIADIAFSGEIGSQNPMYARAEFGVGDFYFASNATLNLLNDLGDPRGTAFYSVATTGGSAGQLRGINQGTIDDEPFTAPASDYSGSSAIAYALDNPVVLMSPWEVWFLRAEAAARYGTADDETTAFTNAVQSSFDFLGVAGGAAYIASLGYSSAAPLDDRIDMIATQKYISLNGTQEDEGWIETRRFDRPASRLFTEGIFQTPPLSVLPAGTFPASWLYPATERGLNPNAPAQRSITDRIFWDN